ncbi:3-isopropylmalate dehydratase large subunit [candidate division WOR-3 bacterium]|nr:3-isopropylmalate dehydratase large subunit [candidate division WOR-3 bacterium]
MGKTIIEKIFATHTRDVVEAGNIIWLDIDVRSARDFGGPNVVKNYEEHYNDTPVADPERTFFTFDLVAPAKTIKYAINQSLCRNFAKKHDIKVFDVDAGIGSHILMEEGYIIPGSTAVGTDSHYNIVGAVGGFGQGMGDVDITFVFKTGKTWFEVPSTVRINIEGEYKFPVTAKDLTLYILKIIKTEFGLGKAIEFYGDAVESLPLYGRITLLSMVTEMGGIIGYIPFTDKTIQEIKKFTGVGEFPIYYTDINAKYEREITIDISGIKPQVAAPPYPHNVIDVDELSDVKVDLIYIGSCTNGRREDIEEAAKILKGRKVKEGTVLSIAPATKRVYRELLLEGVIKDLFEAGAIIMNPSCAGCAEGHIGLTGEGEVSLNTSNRNYPGKQGKGKTFLVSPVVAAASAIKGRITNPEDVL